MDTHAGDDLVEVRLLHYPLDLQQRSAEQFDALKREFSLIALDPDTAHDVPRRLLNLAAEVSQRYEPMLRDVEAQRHAALGRGETVADLTYFLPRSAVAPLAGLREVLAEADAYCRAGRHLLTLASDPDVARFRRWYLREFEGQLAGSSPTPWPDYRE